ncbi:MAG: hypothetical protein IKM02_03100, partial [Clostridia bacterium]|nr:hypothetical protein [Clostridia bacterium]
MNGGNLQIKKEKSRSLIDELQDQVVKAEGWKNQKGTVGQEAQTKKGMALSQKIKGLRVLANQVKGTKKVVSADMLTPDILKEYQKNYGLSKKDMERMLGDLQKGVEVDFDQESSNSIGEQKNFQNLTRSPLSKEVKPGKTTLAIRNKLGETLSQKRGQGMATYQKATLTEKEVAEYKKTYGLSKKELEKLSLDIQTGALMVDTYPQQEQETEPQQKQETGQQQEQETEQLHQEQETEQLHQEQETEQLHQEQETEQEQEIG